MKKVILLLVVAIVATIAIASAQNRRNVAPRQNQKTCFVDTNSNGICDKYESGACKNTCQTPCLRNGSGCPNGVSECPNGGGCANFTDANNNGVCDNREAVRTPKFSKKRLNAPLKRK